MNKVKVEFYHDIICSFCFPMSYRMRQVQAAMPNVEIIHRSFALVPKENDFEKMFPSRAQAKIEIMSHWEHANQNDDLHRFNIEGMKATNFEFPYSMPALLAAKASGIVGGNSAYWDAFDALQAALFVENTNVQDNDIIEKAIRTTDIEFNAWLDAYEAASTKQAVQEDLQRGMQFGVYSAPTLIINEALQVSGAQPLEVIIGAINQATNSSEETDASTSAVGGTCNINPDGSIDCESK